MWSCSISSSPLSLVPLLSWLIRTCQKISFWLAPFANMLPVFRFLILYYPLFSCACKLFDREEKSTPPPQVTSIANYLKCLPVLFMPNEKGVSSPVSLSSRGSLFSISQLCPAWACFQFAPQSLYAQICIKL